MVAELHNQAHHNREVASSFEIYWPATKQRDLQGHCVGVRVLFYESLRTWFRGFFFFFSLHSLCLTQQRAIVGYGTGCVCERGM